MNKKITITALIMLAVIMLLSGGVQAYQSIPTGTPAGLDGYTWFVGIRRIEASTGGMGFYETLNTTTLLGTTASNNIDVHMQKNTEYGAAVLLSASAYGKQGNGTSGSNYVNTNTYGLATSTGNVYGMYELGQGWEQVAGVGSMYIHKKDRNEQVNTRYYDFYPLNSNWAKTGDAGVETNGWHGGTKYTYGAVYFGWRGNGSAFSYRLDQNAGTYSSRAVIVSGTGF